MSTTNDYGLSDVQAQALEPTGDVALVAGAGSGKTHTLTALVARDMVELGIPAEQILVCTFTRAAAANLSSRIEARVRTTDPSRASDVTTRLMCGTIDSICSRLVADRALDLGVPIVPQLADARMLAPVRLQATQLMLADLTPDDRDAMRALLSPRIGFLATDLHSIYATTVQQRIDLTDLTVPPAVPVSEAEIKTLLKKMDALLKSGLLADSVAERVQLDRDRVADGRISETTGSQGKLKEAAKPQADAIRATLEEFRAREVDVELYPLAQAIATALPIYDAHYREIKRDLGLTEFTDIAELSLELDTLDSPRRFARVYIDEAQDTSPLQLDVLRSLRAEDGALIPVGDANQSIYGFRDADVAGFTALVQSLGDTVDLAENYRTQATLLDHVNDLAGSVLQGSGGTPLTMTAVRDERDDFAGTEVLFTLDDGRAPTAADEARVAVPQILDRAERLNIPLSQIAILCPSGAIIRAYRAELVARGVPCLAIESSGLLDRPECADLLAYLRLLANPSDQVSFVRVVTSPMAGLSLGDVKSLLDQVRLSWKDNKAGKLPEPAMPRLAEELGDHHVALAFERVQALVGRVSVAALARAAVAENNFDLALEASDPTGSALRNVERLIATIARIESDLTGPSITEVLDSLFAEDEPPELRRPVGIDAVNLMTVHRSKGLEFDLVALARLGQGSNNDSPRVMIARDGTVGAAKSGKATTVMRELRQQKTDREEEERRRVAYVGITRAREHLMLIASGSRKKEGTASWRGTSSLLLGDALGLDGTTPTGQSETVTLTRTGAAITVTHLDPDAVVEVPRAESEPTDAAPAVEIEAIDAAAIAPIAHGAVSYSRLEHWRSCSLRRYLDRDLGLSGRGARISADTTDEATLAIDDPDRNGAEFGALVHETLELVDWRAGLDVDAALAAAEQREAARANPRLLTDGDRTRLTACLKMAAASPAAEQLRSAREVRSEVPFATSIGGQLVTGVIDVLATLDDGSTLVVDWKTGANFDAHEADYDLQRRLYILALLQQHDAPASIEALWIHLEGEGHEQVRVATAGDLGALRAELEQELEQILLAPAVNAVEQPDDRCLGCPGLEQLCPVSRRPSPKPDIFRAFIGGYMGSWYSCELTPGGLLYKCSERGLAATLEELITPTDDEWRAFTEALLKAGAEGWAPHYTPDAVVMDGTHWSVTVQGRSISVASGGANASPAKFKSVLKAISTLAGGRAFS